LSSDPHTMMNGFSNCRLNYSGKIWFCVRKCALRTWDFSGVRRAFIQLTAETTATVLNLNSAGFPLGCTLVINKVSWLHLHITRLNGICQTCLKSLLQLLHWLLNYPNFYQLNDTRYFINDFVTIVTLSA
jgi:hypothetical protein